VGVPRAFRGIRLAPLGLALAIDSLRLPGDLHACPADRRIVVTAGVKSLLSPGSDGAGMRKERPDPRRLHRRLHWKLETALHVMVNPRMC